MNRFEAIRLLLAAMCIAILFYLLSALPARADVLRQLSSMYCGSETEIASLLTDYSKELEGIAGAEGKQGMGEVWLNTKTSEWFFVERMSEKNIACVILGGQKFTMAGAPT